MIKFIYFYGKKCLSSNYLKPTIEKVIEYGIPLEKHSWEDGKKIFFDYKVKTYPTILVYNDDKLIYKFEGTPKFKELKLKYDELSRNS